MMLRWDCPYCEEQFEAPEGDIKETVRPHLRVNHRNRIEQLFRDNWARNKCQGGCGYRFTFESERDSPMRCPKCGRDHFNYYAGRKVYVEAKELE